MRVAIRGAEIRFGSRSLFRDLSVDFDARGLISISGPSGEGKTSLLMAIGGRLALTSGEILFSQDGREVVPRIGWILQEPLALRTRTVRDNVALSALPIESRSRALAQADSLLEAVGLRDCARRRCGTLSGGEMQRVAVARALASRPDLLLADEPTGQLDTDSSQLVVDAMKAAGRACGVLVVTHDRSVASQCDLSYTLGNGQLVRAPSDAPA